MNGIKKYVFIFSGLLAAASLLLQGCKKEVDEDIETETAEDHALAESIFNELYEIAGQAVTDGQLSTHRFGNGEGGVLAPCPDIAVTIDSANGSGTATIDFGTHYCLGADGIYRRGVLNITFNGAYSSPGTVITITASGFYTGKDTARAIKIIGEQTVTNNGLNTSGKLNYSISVSTTLVNYLNQQMKWYSTKNREWIAGDSTALWSDDESLLTGSANGKSFTGIAFTSVVTQPLHVLTGCRWITGGSFSLSPGDKAPRNFNYGSGACDDKALITIEENSYAVTLK